MSTHTWLTTHPATHPAIDPLTDPSLREQYRQPRSAEELCRIAHQSHMALVDQEGWLKRTYQRADERQAADLIQLDKDLQTFRRTGKMPAKPKPKKGKHS